MFRNWVRALSSDLRPGVLLAIWLAGGLPVEGQSGAAPSGTKAAERAGKMPAFEVVSVRPNNSGQGLELSFTPDGFILKNLPLQPVIVNAYNLHDPELMVGGQRIPGAPKWVNTDPYDIRAKISSSDAVELQKLSSDQQLARKRLMLQSMLADRFRLRVHHEAKAGACYALAIGKNGSKMKVAKSIDPAVPEGKLFAQMGTVTAQGVSIAQLVFALNGPLNCPVQDKTGLTGRYDFTLQYAPGLGSGAMPPSSQQQESAADAAGPSLFTAVREQLGLKLVPAAVPLDGIVIDYIERPSEN